jgi:hypothetical protein
MAIYQQETFYGLKGERVIVTMHSSLTDMQIIAPCGGVLAMGINIVGDWPFVKDGVLYYTTACPSPDGTVHRINEKLDFKMRPTITW